MTKYNLRITNHDLNNYYNNLINGFYKMLPIFEESENEVFKKYVANFMVELTGCYNVFENIEFLKLINISEGILNSECNHKQIKSLVFSCINIINKLRDGDGSEIL